MKSTKSTSSMSNPQKSVTGYVLPSNSNTKSAAAKATPADYPTRGQRTATTTSKMKIKMGNHY